MTRPSLLPLTRHCGYAALLAEKYPEGSVYAVNGSRWHERMHQQVLGKINDPSLAAILGTLPAHAKMESEVKASLVDPEDGFVFWGDSNGRVDLVLTLEDGSLIIIDWKTGSPDKVDPPDDNYQLLAYGLALALERGAPRFRVGLYFTELPPLQLGRWFTDGADYWETLAALRAAATADRTRPITGPHCDKCYSRKHCSAWVLPATVDGALAPIAEGKGGITAQNAPGALRTIQAMEDIIKIAKARLQDFARETGGIHDGGKVWAPGLINGRRSVSVEAADAAGLLPQLEAAGAVNNGKPYERFSWRNASKRDRAA